MAEQRESIIGYSGFETFEECYGYNENACFIADTAMAAEVFMQEAAYGEFRIVPVTLAQIMDDFGCSVGEFAMEKAAFERFREAANAAGVRFAAELFDRDDDLMVVNVEGVKIHDD